MTIGSSILLIAVGAILKWAVTAHVKGVDLQTVGTILFVLGILGLVLSIAYTFRARRGRPRWWRDADRRAGHALPALGRPGAGGRPCSKRSPSPADA